MQLTPRYGPDPLIVLDGPPGAVVAPLARQRRRLVELLGGLDADQWAHPSRCAGWSVRDVIVHLDGTDRFWRHSVTAGLRGEPTELLASFDPAATPAAMVAGAPDLSGDEVLAAFAASSAALVELLEGLDEADWACLAEAPPGHVAITALAHHALWDSWVHERDVARPLGIASAEVADEVIASLRYVAALGPAIAVAWGRTETGVLAVEGTDPAVGITVTVADAVRVGDGAPATADLRLTGSAVDLLEALSIRAPLAPDVPEEAAWMLRGLAEVFDTPPEERPA